MFTLAIFLGTYSYIIFSLGLLGVLYKPVIYSITALFAVSTIYYFRLTLINLFKFEVNLKKIYFNKLFFLLLVLITLQSFVNIIGALGPELAFDALWYHLTFPKLYLINHSVIHIPGGLLYYADMPKLMEMIYTGALIFNIDFLPKVIHFLFGILTLVTLYKLSRKWFSPIFSLLIVIIFSSSLVFGWESITAYIDLGRTFFEILALWAFMLWVEKRESKWFLYSAFMMGFAISTKIIAISSLLIFLILILFVLIKDKPNILLLLKQVSIYLLVSLLIPLPWFIFSYIHTGNPVYPLFDPILGITGSVGLQLLNPIYFTKTFFELFTHSSDPISPWYLMLLPLIIWFYKKVPQTIKYIYWYSGLSLLFWYITPNTGGGRFILPYLPAFSILSIFPVSVIQKKQQKYLIFLAIILSLISIAYRGIANFKYIPVILHKEASTKFLSKNLNFSFGDFVDSDGYFKTHIKPNDKVLLSGISPFWTAI